MPPDFRPAVAGVFLTLGLALASPEAASAQYYYGQPQAYQPAPAYYYPQAEPEYRYPRARRALQVVADPTLLLSPDSRFSSGQPPTDYPLFDAAPNISNLVFLALFARNTVLVNSLAFGLPPAIRLARVLIIGPPEVARDRNETLLWIAEPTLLMIRHRREAKRAAEANGYPAGYGQPANCGCVAQPQPRRRLFHR